MVRLDVNGRLVLFPDLVDETNGRSETETNGVLPSRAIRNSSQKVTFMLFPGSENSRFSPLVST